MRGRNLQVLALVVALVATLVVPLTSTAHASEIDRFDLDSISLQPAYISASLLRQSSCLRAVAVAPPSRTPTSPGTSIAIAVGDGGAILRSDDGGETWRAVEKMQLDAPAASTHFGHSARRTEDPPPIPFCDFTDVLWASPLDVIVVGGGYEPVTGISRGICMLSRDGGRTWHLSDAHELPRLQKLRMGGPATSTTLRNRSGRELAPGVLEAVGDASEASGVDHFYSYDGGQTWVEDIRTTSSSQDANQLLSDAKASSRTRSIQTAAGSVSVNDLTAPGDAWQFAVSSHGRIWRRGETNSTWQAVRGQGRGTAVLFVASSPATVPWSLAGRESLHEHRRTAVLIDTQQAETVARRDMGRCRAATTMLGISDVDCVASNTERMDWLAENRPAVVVLDESLSPATQQAWWALVQQARTRPVSPSRAVEANDWNGPQRTILTRRVHTRSNQAGEQDRTNLAWYRNDADPRWQRAWNNTSVLRGNALLSGPGVLANDLATDALMLAAPHQSAPLAIEVATLDDASGSVRRDVALAAGLALTEGQNRGAAETLTASNRRLQITTARMNQTRRLHDELFQSGHTHRSPAEQSRLTDKIEQLLAVTSPEDRTRLLWDALATAMTSEHQFPQVRESLLSLISSHGQPAAVQRWADLNTETLSSSVECRSVTSPDPIADWQRKTPNVLGNVAGNLGSHAGSSKTPNSNPGRTESGHALSPFQVTPVSYEEEVAAPKQRFSNSYTSTMQSPQRTAPAVILVPESKPIPWQATRGWASLAAPLGTNPGADSQARNNEEAADLPARINWDYHPVVMAARGIVPQDRGTTTPVSAQQSGGESGRKTSGYAPPQTSDRPLLDGHDDDPCWTTADHWVGDGYEARCVADEEYLYFAITVANSDGVRLSLDCDGDYFTAMRFEISRDGDRQVSVDAVGTISPVWYSAVANEISPTASDAADAPLLAEVAIARSSLPAPVCRVQVCPASPLPKKQWEVMPKAFEWYPTP